MKIEVISTEYDLHQRIDTVKHTYNLSDDYIQLGQLYYTLGISMSKGESTDNINALIAAQLKIIAGYS